MGDFPIVCLAGCAKRFKRFDTVVYLVEDDAEPDVRNANDARDAVGDVLPLNDDDLVAYAKAFRAFLLVQYSAFYYMYFNPELSDLIDVQTTPTVDPRVSVKSATLDGYVFYLYLMLLRSGRPQFETGVKTQLYGAKEYRNLLGAIRGYEAPNVASALQGEETKIDERTAEFRRFVKRRVYDYCVTRSPIERIIVGTATLQEIEKELEEERAAEYERRADDRL